MAQQLQGRVAVVTGASRGVGRAAALALAEAGAYVIALARTRFARHKWIEADMMRFGGDSGAYDGILAWCSLFHLEVEQQEKLLRRIGVWLRKGGVALFNTGPANGIAMGQFEGEDLFHASLSPAEYRAILADSGLTVVNHVSEDANCGGMTVWLVGKI